MMIRIKKKKFFHTSFRLFVLYTLIQISLLLLLLLQIIETKNRNKISKT